jgi:hypothetical protein
VAEEWYDDSIIADPDRAVIVFEQAMPLSNPLADLDGMWPFLRPCFRGRDRRKLGQILLREYSAATFPVVANCCRRGGDAVILAPRGNVRAIQKTDNPKSRLPCGGRM